MSPAAKNDPLHFPRANLAHNCFLVWGMGNQCISIYAQRRVGKTTFLQNDITDEANRMGVRAEYFTFMGKTNPRHAFVDWLVDLVRGGGINRAAKGTKFTMEGTIPGIAKLSAEAILSDPADAGLEKLMKQLAKQEPGMVLMLDEFQELADDLGNKSFIGSLRSALDSNREIKAIFTGSSIEKLQKVFEDVHAPFYNGASSLPFPKLGEDFTNFLADHYYAKRPCAAFSRDNVLWAHTRLGGVTKDTRDFMTSLMIADKIGDFADHLEHFAAQVERQYGPIESGVPEDEIFENAVEPEAAEESTGMSM